MTTDVYFFGLNLWLCVALFWSVFHEYITMLISHVQSPTWGPFVARVQTLKGPWLVWQNVSYVAHHTILVN